MPRVSKTSEVMKDGTTRQVKQPKFKLGEIVRLVGVDEVGYTGKIVLSEPLTDRYLVDCFPGALPFFDRIWIDRGKGPNIEALNWLFGKNLRKLRKGCYGRIL